MILVQRSESVRILKVRTKFNKLMVLPTAYLPPLSYMQALMREPATIEQMETFEKQTFRNRCTICKPSAISNQPSERIILTVPVKKVEHKQLTRDIEISYQSRWQHQHWITLVSAYQHTPYFLYFADYLRPFYEKEYKWLLDLNDEMNETIASLLRREKPQIVESGKWKVERTSDWSGEIWTDKHPWQTELSVLDTLFED